MSASQIPMDFAFRTAFGRENFLVASPNENAVAWIDKWPNWPSPYLLVIGPESSGKTHLGQVWQQRTNANVLTCAELAELDLSQLAEIASGAIVVEDLQQKIPEEKLFHLYNLVKEKGGFLLMTASEPVANWDIQLPDLKSRMGAVQIVRIDEPDDMLFASILLKLFADRQLQVTPEVVQYLLTRIERSFGEAARIVSGLDGLALSEKRKITIPLVRDLLQKEGH